MRTKQEYTHALLDSYTTFGKLDIDYISHLVIITADNNEPTSKEKYNTRRKPRTIAIEWLMYWINTELSFSDWAGYTATNKHVMNWNKTHAGQLDAVLDKVAEYITEDRNEK